MPLLYVTGSSWIRVLTLRRDQQVLAEEEKKKLGAIMREEVMDLHIDGCETTVRH
jgi:hypothetical protein